MIDLILTIVTLSILCLAGVLGLVAPLLADHDACRPSTKDHAFDR